MIPVETVTTHLTPLIDEVIQVCGYLVVLRVKRDRLTEVDGRMVVPVEMLCWLEDALSGEVIREAATDEPAQPGRDM